MKTIKNQIMTVLGLMIFTFGIFGCQKKADEQPLSYYMNQSGFCMSSQGHQVDQSFCQMNSGYVLQPGGQCYSTQTGQYVQQSFCNQGQYNSQYTLIGNQCVVRATNQVVDPSYCYNNQGGMGQVCNGNFMMSDGRVITCGVMYGGYNCSGYTLIELQTNRQVRCQ